MLCTEGCSCFVGTKWDGTSVWSRCWPKTLLWLQHLLEFDYSCFYVDLIKTGSFTEDWGFDMVVEHSGDKPEWCFVCKTLVCKTLQWSFKDQPETAWCCLKAKRKAAAKDTVKDSVIRLSMWAWIRAACCAVFHTCILSPDMPHGFQTRRKVCLDFSIYFL